MIRRALLAGVLGFLMAACSGGVADRPVLDVYAASSLTDAFRDLERAFEATEEVDVRLTFAGSQILRLQIEGGAPADVFASANVGHMDALASSGHVQTRQTLAHNELVVVVPEDNPAGITRFEDLPRANRLVVGAAQVPVGGYTQQILDRAAGSFGHAFRADVAERIVSKEPNVRLARAKVELGEADAAIVYRSDAVTSRRVRPVRIPAALNVRAAYPIGALTGARDPRLAQAWLTFVRSPRAQRILRKHGFVVDG